MSWEEGWVLGSSPKPGVQKERPIPPEIREGWLVWTSQSPSRPPSTVLVHLHGHEATTLTSGVLNFLFATPVGAAITDEAGQESNESGESHADQ